MRATPRFVFSLRDSGGGDLETTKYTKYTKASGLPPRGLRSAVQGLFGRSAPFRVFRVFRGSKCGAAASPARRENRRRAETIRRFNLLTYEAAARGSPSALQEGSFL